MSPLSPWRAALRIARRETLRAKGRSLLVVALLGLPVAIIGCGAVLYASFELTPEQAVVRELGAADVAVAKPYDVPVEQLPTEFAPYTDTELPPAEKAATERDILGLLPPGSRAIPERLGEATVGTRAGETKLAVRELGYDDPIARGLLTPLDGRAPRTADEVALTTAAAERTGLGIGDTLRVLEPQRRAYRVVGLVEDPGDLTAKQVVGMPGSLPGTLPENTRWLVDTPSELSWDDVRAMNREGAIALSRHVLLNPPPNSEVAPGLQAGESDAGEVVSLTAIVVGTAILEIVLLAGPAFAISARRRQREIALLAAVGGTPAQLRRVLLADGIVLGAVGAAAGLVLGVLGAAVALPPVEEYVIRQRSGGFDNAPLWLAGIAALAVATGLLAAVLPAILAARTDVVAALAGRRGVTRSRARWLLLGLLVTGCGAAAAAYGATGSDTTLVMTGLVLSQLGLALCTPSLIGAVSRVSGWLPLAPRIALRNTSRIRSAAAPAIAAVMAAVAAAVTIGMLWHAEQTRHASQYRAGLPDGYAAVSFNGTPQSPERVAALMRRTVPLADTYLLREATCAGPAGDQCMVGVRKPDAVRCPLDGNPTASPDEIDRYAEDPRCRGDGGWMSWSPPSVLVDDGTGLAALTGADPDELRTARTVLADGGVVVSDPSYVERGRVSVAVTGMPEDPDGKPREGVVATARAHLLRSGTLSYYTVVISPELARELKLVQRVGGVVGIPSRAITVAEYDRLTSRVRALSKELTPYVERGPGRADDAVLLILGALAGMITLGAAAIATGLVAADGRPELATLAAVGATPGLRRWLMLAQSGVIAGLGTVLGGLSGVGAATVLIVAINAGAEPGQPPLPVALPWPVLLLTVVLVPLVAMTGAGLFTRARLPIERRLA